MWHNCYSCEIREPFLKQTCRPHQYGWYGVTGCLDANTFGASNTINQTASSSQLTLGNEGVGLQTGVTRSSLMCEVAASMLSSKADVGGGRQNWVWCGCTATLLVRYGPEQRGPEVRIVVVRVYTVVLTDVFAA